LTAAPAQPAFPPKKGPNGARQWGMPSALDKVLLRRGEDDDRERAVYPVVPFAWRDWQHGVVGYLLTYADSMESVNSGTARAIRRRAISFLACLTAARVRTCECGYHRPGSGIPDGQGAPCQSRSCPRCARRRAAKASIWLERAVDHVESTKDEAEGYRWRHITLTVPYDPRDPAEVTPTALRERVRILRKAWRAIWTPARSARERATWPGLGGPDRAAFFSVELAGTGNVHAHVLYWGPFVSKKSIETVASRATGGRSGFMDIRECQGKNGAKEVAKYSVKSPGGRAERWLSGVSRETIHPALAASWEIATFGAQLVSRYGLFRALPDPEDEEIEDERIADDEVVCPVCGSSHWHDELVALGSWIRYCHANGFTAFHKME